MEKFNPTISVVLVVRNGEKFIREAVSSILEQTYENFEFLIIDDGSADHTKEIVRKYRDTRIQLFDNPGPSGKPGGLNFAFETAKGQYIALMDADDISLPTRFEKQLRFLEQNPEIGIVGAQAIKINEVGEVIGYQGKNKMNHQGCRKLLLTGNSCFINPSVLIRKASIPKGINYKKDYPYAEDYDFFCQSFFHTKFANLGERLIKYRIHEEQISSRHLNKQKKLANIIFSDFLSIFILNESTDKVSSQKNISILKKISEGGGGDLST
ncbi:MAG: glycosyltransferase [Gammaproteobacteria bacterium]|nr:glycosyltransferase [Gammaproteobacteria bacterium]